MKDDPTLLLNKNKVKEQHFYCCSICCSHNSRCNNVI